MFSLRRIPGTVDPAAPVEDVLVGLAVLLEGPDVLPVLVIGDDVAVERLAGLEQRGKSCLEKSKGSPSGTRASTSGSST